MNQESIVELEFHTTLGAVYKFPDVIEEEVIRLLARFSASSNLTLTNVSGAALVLPTRIVGRILVNGEERWTRS